MMMSIFLSPTHALRAAEQLTFEQQPPKIRASMPPAASHCGMVSMMMRPARAMMREEAGRGSSMPYISAFSSEGAALMTLGTTRPPSETTAEAWRSRSVARRRDTGMEKVDEVGEGALLESVLRFLAIQARRAAGEGGLGLGLGGWSWHW